MARVKMNSAAVKGILKAAQPHTSRLADRLAAGVTNAVGQVDGAGVEPVRYDQPTDSRARSAVLLSHRTPAGRAAANKAATALIQTIGE